MASLLEEHLTRDQIFSILRKIHYPLDNPNVLPEPTLETLRELNYRCMTTFPFELFSLRCTESRSVDLSIQTIYDRLVNKNRGGWCFSLNKFAYELLRGVGFTVQYTLGRVCKPLHLDDPIVYLGLTHRLTLVRFANGDKYVFDIGFGPTSFYPLKIEEGAEVEYFGHRRRLVKEIHNEEEPNILDKAPEELWQVQEYMGKDKVSGQERWTPCYTFTEQQYYAVDCDIGNFWCCYSPKSPFTGSLWVVNATRDGVYNILIDKSFKVRSSQGTIKNVTIETEQERQDILKEYFNIVLTEEEWKHYDIKIE
ncbi:N-terminal acetyltransferase [Gryganskiella cystojenkinii]|nr:N-terminal acetyltransferase [Gryganskiella cystojenkinii]